MYTIPITKEDREKYKAISRLLDQNPEILDRVHADLKKLSQGGHQGREADFTSETILRTLVVHAITGLSLRETVVLIAGSDFLQDFLQTRKKAVMDFTFLDKCLLAGGLEAAEAGAGNLPGKLFPSVPRPEDQAAAKLRQVANLESMPESGIAPGLYAIDVESSHPEEQQSIAGRETGD